MTQRRCGGLKGLAYSWNTGMPCVSFDLACRGGAGDLSDDGADQSMPRGALAFGAS